MRLAPLAIAVLSRLSTQILPMVPERIAAVNIMPHPSQAMRMPPTMQNSRPYRPAKERMDDANNWLVSSVVNGPKPGSV